MSGYTTVSASRLQDASGTLLNNCTISFQPVTNTGVPVSFKVGGPGGQTVSQAVTAPVINGAFSLSVADTSLTRPVNIGYRVTIMDDISGKSMLGIGYGCVQPSGLTFDFDALVPNLASQVTVQTGPKGDQGDTGDMGPQGVPGAVTAIGSNGDFTVPGVLTVERTTPVAVPSGVPGTKIGLSHTAQYYGGSKSIGNPLSYTNGSPWTVQHGSNLQVTTALRGIAQIYSGNLYKHAVGDVAGVYTYVQTDGGCSARSDEGVSAMSVHADESRGYFHGSIAATTGKGDVQPSLAFSSGNDWTTDGAFLLNISKGTLSGSLTPQAQPLVGGSQLAQRTVSGVTLPLTTAWGVTTDVIPYNNTTTDIATAVTLKVELQAIGNTVPNFVAGCLVWVAGSNYVEQAVITDAETSSTNTQNITLNLRYPNDGAVIFQGGLVGQYVSMDANLNFSGMRTSWYAFGSLTGADLIYGTVMYGSLQSKMPYAGAEAASTSGPGAAFHLFPGAEIIRNNSMGADPQLEPNNVQWEVGDLVENPHYPYYSGFTKLISSSQDTPCTSDCQTIGEWHTTSGKGIGQGYQHVLHANTNPNSLYQAFGGPLKPPPYWLVEGIWANGFYFQYGPSQGGASLYIEQAQDANDVRLVGFGFSPAVIDLRRSDNTIHIPALSATQLIGGTHVVNGGLTVDYNIDADHGHISYGGLIVDGPLRLGSGVAFRRDVAFDQDFTVQVGHYLIAYSNLTATRTVFLPKPSDVINQTFVIKDESGMAGTYPISLSGTANGYSATIDGQNTKALNTAYGVLRLYSTGSSWFTV